MSFAAPIGISDFRSLRAADATYVDKTASIAELLCSPMQVQLFPRPRRFGKSLWLSTLQAFVDRAPQGREGADERRALFEGLAIWDDPAARTHLARYPVIAMSFKDVKYDTWDDCRRGIIGVIVRAFLVHRALRPQLDGYDATIFDAVISRQADLVLYSESLAFLSEVLHRHYGERAVVLIDEYDTPIHAGYSHGYYDQVVGFFRNLLSGGLKDNAHLFKGVLTGILRVAKESIFSGLNNLDVYSILRPEHATSFGFTAAEVESLAQAAEASEHLPTIRDWYDGYVFGGETLYNPWSVLKFLDSRDKVPRAHWVATGSDDVLRRMLTRGSLGALPDQEALLAGDSVERTLAEPLALRDIDGRDDSAWSLLLFSGYLTATEVVHGDEEVRVRLRIPNREVRRMFMSLVGGWWRAGLGSDMAVDAVLAAVLAGEGERVREGLEDLFLAHVSYHDLPQPARELPYHMFVLGLLVRLADDYEVRSNPESGRGRADVLITPRSPGAAGVVMEFKRFYPERDGSPEAALDAAMAQIDDRAYAAALRDRGAAPVHAYAAVFEGKRVHLRVRTEA
ncbi:AAA family ATPase [Haliangium sp.]|uniref:AAA family ATPase n=1 Tax=Haliangium sp. TaxID=2663208 RepID=UPI003D1117D0